MGNLLDHLVAIGLPSAMLYFFCIIPLRKVYRARAWRETPCVILSSAVEEDRGESGVYRILITYGYEVAGRSYSSSRYDFSTGATAGFRGKRTVVNRLAPGKTTVCYVNPTDPTDSVIKRGITWDILFWGVFAAILLITFGFFVQI
jgi:uncharacterized protein DUF3592